jgi:hypothetical protein
MAPAGRADRRVLRRRVTLSSLWSSFADVDHLTDALIWPPDLFALVNRALEASEAYRLVVSPPADIGFAGVGVHARAAAREWWASLDEGLGSCPESVTSWWNIVSEAADVGIEDLAEGDEWPITVALLELHAIADEACAGLGSAMAVEPGPGCVFRATARELLAETGSLSRLSPGLLRVLPRCRVGLTGISIHSLSRHVCVCGPQVDVQWHRMLSRPTDVAPPEEHANILLFPWPLQVRARDFRPVPYTLPSMDTTEFGFFEFAPREPLDLDLLDRLLEAAEDESGSVDVVFLPEAAIEPTDVEPLEDLLGGHGVWCVIAGVREACSGGQLGANWVHVGIRHELVWRHARQYKHHRWCLDGRQIRQYHLGGALSPTMQWWEAVSIPPRSLQIIDQGAITLAPLVCEDLARLEPVPDLLRAVGPSLVLTVLLDGPQLASRWTARYASVLADDPGSAVLTLSSHGMVRRCRPPGCPASPVIALWKDATGALTEIGLEDGADGVLIATNVVMGGCTTADGRRHPATTSNLNLAAVQSLRARDATSRSRAGSVREPPAATPALRPLDEREASKATSWAEAAAEAVVAGPDVLESVLAAATASEWRQAMGLPSPSRLFEHSIEALRGVLPRPATLDALRTAITELRGSNDPAASVSARLIDIALEQRLLAEVSAGRLPSDLLRSPVVSHPAP